MKAPVQWHTLTLPKSTVGLIVTTCLGTMFNGALRKIFKMSCNQARMYPGGGPCAVWWWRPLVDGGPCAVADPDTMPNSRPNCNNLIWNKLVVVEARS